jgi:uncharacterized damage-inducible protein DinB
MGLSSYHFPRLDCRIHFELNTLSLRYRGLNSEEIHMQDDIVALFAYDRWANDRVLDACRRLTDAQYVAEPVAVRATVEHIAVVTEMHVRTLAGGSEDGAGVELATVDDAGRLLERAYRRFEELRPMLTPEWLGSMLTLRGHDDRIGDYAFTLPRWAMLRHTVTHSTYHRGQVASKLKRFGIEQANTDFFFWAIGQVPQGV